MRKRISSIKDRRLQKLNIYSDLFQHWDNSFWSATYVFLALQGALLFAFAQVYTNPNIGGEKVILMIFSIGGAIISLLWLFVMNRKMSYTRGSEQQLNEAFIKL